MKQIFRYFFLKTLSLKILFLFSTCLCPFFSDLPFHRPVDEEFFWSSRTQLIFQEYYLLYFPFLIYMMPKICSQGYHFSPGCLGFFSPPPHQKVETKEDLSRWPIRQRQWAAVRRNSGVGPWRGERGRTQPSSGLRLTAESRYRCESGSSRRYRLSLPGQRAASWLQGWVFVSVTSPARFDQFGAVGFLRGPAVT